MSSSTTSSHAIEIRFRPTGAADAARAAHMVGESVIRVAASSDLGADAFKRLSREEQEQYVRLQGLVRAGSSAAVVMDRLSIEARGAAAAAAPLTAESREGAAGLDRLADTVVRTRDELGRFVKGAGAARTALDDLVPPGAAAGLKKLDDQVESLGDRLDRIGGQMQSAGGNLAMGLTAPILAVATVSLKSAVDYESAMIGVQKTTDASAAEIAHLRREFRELSEEVPMSAAALAEVGEAAGQMGVAQSKIAGFARTIASMEVATDLAANAAATGMATFSNVMQTPTENAEKLGATIVALGNAGESTESAILNMGLRIAGAGRQVGMTEAEVLATANALSSLAMEAESGGTSVSTVIKTIHTAVANGGDELKRFALVAGVSAADFAKAWKEDAAGTLVTVVEGLRRIGEQGGNVFAVLNSLDLKDSRVQDTLTRLAGASDKMRASIELGNQAWREGSALQKEAAMFNASTASQMRVLGNVVTNIAADLGTELIPVLRIAATSFRDDVLPVVSGAIKVFSDLPDGVQTTVVVMATMTATVGPLVMVVGTLTQTVGTLAKGYAVARSAVISFQAAAALSGIAISGATASAALLGTTLAVGAPVLVGLGALVVWLARAGDGADDMADKTEAAAARAANAATSLRATLDGMDVETLRYERDALDGQMSRNQAEIAALRKEMPGMSDEPIWDAGDPQNGGPRYLPSERAQAAERLDAMYLLNVRFSNRLAELHAEIGEREAAPATPSAALHPLLAGGEEDTARRGASKRPTPNQLLVPGPTMESLAATVARTGPDRRSWAALGLVHDQVIDLGQQIEKTRGESELAFSVLQQQAPGTDAFQVANERVADLRAELAKLEAQLPAALLALRQLAPLHGLGFADYEKGVLAVRDPGPAPMASASIALTPGRGLDSQVARDAAAGRSTLHERNRAQAETGRNEQVKAHAEEMRQASEVAVRAFGDVTQAFILGSEDMASAVVSNLTSIAQAIPGVGGFAGAMLGAAGGIIGGLFASRERAREEEKVQRVRLDEYGERALSQMNDGGGGPQHITIQMIDPGTGRVTGQNEYTLSRRTRRDAVDRFPPTGGYSQGGGTR